MGTCPLLKKLLDSMIKTGKEEALTIYLRVKVNISTKNRPRPAAYWRPACCGCATQILFSYLCISSHVFLYSVMI